ncbi:hypothetical protein BJV74DRAFT_862758 [Russula compacta]|nr:hypothetical protein BJV74DRAFT_862758 [Russula compacta]
MRLHAVAVMALARVVCGLPTRLLQSVRRCPSKLSNAIDGRPMLSALPTVRLDSQLELERHGHDAQSYALKEFHVRATVSPIASAISAAALFFFSLSSQKMRMTVRRARELLQLSCEVLHLIPTGFVGGEFLSETYIRCLSHTPGQET